MLESFFRENPHRPVLLYVAMLILKFAKGIFVLLILSLVFLESTFVTLGFAQGYSPAPTVIPCWSYKSDGVIKAVTSDDSKTFIAKEGARLEAVSSFTGERIWAAEFGGEITSNIVSDGKQVFVTARTPSPTRDAKISLRSLSSETGITNWISEISGSGNVAVGLVGSDIFNVTNDGVITSISASNGKQNWVQTVGPLSTLPVFFGGQIVVSTEGKKILLLSVSNGRISTDVPVSNEVSALAVDESTIYWGDQRGNVNAYNWAENKYRWQLKQGGRIVSLELTDDGLLIASADNFVYLFSRGYGKRRWKRRLENRVANVADWTKDFILVLDTSGEQVSILDLDNGRLINKIPSPAGEPFTLLPGGASGQALVSTPGSLYAYRSGSCSLK